VNSLISKLVLAVGIAATLGACASIGAKSFNPERDRLAQIHSGLTQQEVRDLAGRPDNVTSDSRTGAALWIYSYEDLWGYPSEFDVTFDENGKVASTYSERNY
jgi:outer membrane protein assembly factor BamE (lipoprotein component of BamABCDE complex)